MPPGLMRLFVRIEGASPFCLVLDDNLLPDHYSQIAQKYFKENWTSTRQPPELVLIRRIIFRSKDQLFDFRRKKKSNSNVQLKSGGTAVLSKLGPSITTKVYDPLLSPDVIRQELVVTNPPSAAMVAHSETDLVIKAVTLNRLIIKMTDPTSTGFLEDVFLDTYRAYATAHEVLDRVIERYDIPPIARVGHPQRTPLDVDHYVETQQAIRLRIFRFLEKWVRRYFFDFADDNAYHKLTRFVREKIDADHMPTEVVDWMRRSDRTPLAARPRMLPPGIVNANLTPSTVLSRYQPRDIANQLTLLTLQAHNAILAPELVGRQWEGAEAANVPNFIAYRDFVNRVANWIAYSIVSEPELSVRAANMGAVLQICDALLRLHNWDMLVAVYGGISDPAVARLTQTAAALSSETKPLLGKFEELLSLRGTSKSLKAAMAASPRPSFPSLVVHLRDLLKLEEAPVAFEGGLINFMRTIDQYNLIRFLLDGQGAKLNIVPQPELQGVFSFWKVVEDRVLQQKSVEAQRA